MIYRLSIALALVALGYVLWANLGADRFGPEEMPHEWKKDSASAATSHQHGSPLGYKGKAISKLGGANPRDSVVIACLTREGIGRWAVARGYDRQTRKYTFARDTFWDIACIPGRLTNRNQEWHQTGTQNPETGRITWGSRKSLHRRRRKA